jgi:hypothetical protein
MEYKCGSAGYGTLIQRAHQLCVYDTSCAAAVVSQSHSVQKTIIFGQNVFIVFSGSFSCEDSISEVGL